MALEIFRMIGSVFVDTDAANKSLQNTDKNAEGLGTTLANGIKSVGKFAAGIGAAVGAAGAGLAAVAESTRDYRTEQGKLQAAFETAGLSAQAARTTYEELNGILGDSGQAVEAANHLAQLTQNEKDLQTWTNICTGIFATFGDSLPIEGLTEAANETAKVGQVTGPLADALNWAGVSEDAFNDSLAACTTEQERQALIAETLNGLYSEAADSYRKVNGEVIEANKSQDKLNSVMADIGKTIEPIVTKGKELVAEVLERAAPVITDLANVAIPFLAASFETLVSWLDATVQWLGDAYNWMQENETAVTVIAIAVGTFTAALIAYNIAQNAATIATTIATAATTAFGAVMAFVTSPITLVVAAIGALIAIVYLLVTHWDEVKAAAVTAWEFIKDVWATVAEWFMTNVVEPVVTFFRDLWEGIKDIWNTVATWFDTNVIQPIVGFFTGMWDGIVSIFTTAVTWFDTNVIQPIVEFFRVLWETVSGYFVNLWNDIVATYHMVIDPWVEIFRRAAALVNEEVIQPVIEFFRQLWETVSGFFTSLWNDVVTIFITVAAWFDTNVIQPVTNLFKKLKETLTEAFRSAWEGVKKVWSSVADFFKNTVWGGIKNAFSNVTEWFRTVFSKAWQAVKNVFSTGGKVFEGIKEGIVDVFTTVVNAIIRGINKVITIPFNAINRVLEGIRGISILGVSPFSWISTFSVPQIPELEEGGVLERGQVGLLEGNGAEAVVPLHENKRWISAVAQDMDAAMGGSGSQVVALLSDILETLAELAGMGIYLDSDALVGRLAKKMDNKLGQLQAKKARA